jgi:Na+/melibiose symporter-like transporter
MQKTDQQARTLSKKVIYEYGMGEFGWGFHLNLISNYLLIFMTDVIALPVDLAGTLYSVIQWFEALTAIAAGIIIDNVAHKGPRYRPWLTIGSCVCLVGTVIFFTNFHVGTVPAAVIFTLFYFISYAGYNFMWIAYRALIGVIGHTPQETVAMTVSGTQLSTAASLLFSAFGIKLLYAFPKLETGYTVSAVVYCAVMVACMCIVSHAAKPYDLPMEAQAKAGEKTHVPLKDMLRALPPVIPYAISYILSIGASTLLFSLLAYYFNYVMNKPTMYSTLMVVLTVGRLAATFCVDSLVKRFQKRTVYVMSVLAGTVSIVLAYLVRSNEIAFYGFMGLYFFCLVPAGAMFMPCISDATDYNEYAKGIKARSFIFSVASTLSYIAQFVGATVAGVGLVVIGYQSGAGAAQSAATLSGLPVITFLGTAGLTLISAVPMLFYKLTDDVMQPIYKQKEEAMAAAAAAEEALSQPADEQ